MRCELPDGNRMAHGVAVGQQSHLMRHDHHLLACHYDQRTPPNSQMCTLYIKPVYSLH